MLAVRARQLCSSLSFFVSSRSRHTRFDCDWSSDVCSSDLTLGAATMIVRLRLGKQKTTNCMLLAPESLVPLRVKHAGVWLTLREIGRASCRERVSSPEACGTGQKR